MDTRSKTLRRPDFNRVLVALGNKKEAIQKPSLATSKSLKTNLVGNTDSDKENTAFDVAFQQHLEKLQTEERNTFKNAYDQITPEALLDKVKLFDEAHNKGSFARKRIGPLEKFLTVLDGLVKSVSIGIQAYPDVSSLIVGAVKLVVDLALRWVTFFNKFADMLCQFSEYLPSLEKYAKSCDERILQDALANVYGDLLDFCKSGRSIFVHEDGSKKKHVSLRSLLRVQWEPFEIRFGDIKQRIVNHINQTFYNGFQR
ncbi:uncharacterized protein BDZ99DRAFT_90841 [Mytilinidion resinicola]|uniref:DUF7708 domain-containing protein n=1 Tax=Mytilinidion resinicola TaxID=574789 RepID=A0A6A6YEA6_9PEZI|nr:uncharacterized protein BDZ99DRAFT_90841 [Mytilinidion resinicola]KAF2807070.1 hypothetical protein BDZ99DRAFT_90841 [Mytilinidion resinicola]